MNRDDVIYLALLLASICFGELVRRINDARLKQRTTTVLGLAVVYLVSGIHISHALLVTIVNAAFICWLPVKWCHVLSFSFSFSYLVFFRCTNLLGIPIPPAHTNAVIMILTLKMVGLAFEVSDTQQLKDQKRRQDDVDNELELKLRFQGVARPDFSDVFHYAFCYIGVLTGPYYKYRTYLDMLHSKAGLKTSFLGHLGRRLRWLPVYAILFLLSSSWFPLSYARSNEFFEERSFGYRVWYMIPLFFCFRMRFYTGFGLSEGACIAAGLGAYPVRAYARPGQGPTVLAALSDGTADDKTEALDFETVHNIDEYGADFADSVRASLKTWNMTVQYWLAVNVHRRFPLRALRTTVTLLTSAFWHGVYSGYYLSIMTVPLILVAEDLARRKLRPLNVSVFDRMGWLLKSHWFAYMGVAFSLLELDTTLRYWSSVYYVGHWIIVLLYVVALLAPQSKPTVSKTAEQTQ